MISNHEQHIDMRLFPRSFEGDHPVNVGIWVIVTIRPVDWSMENVHLYNYLEEKVPAHCVAQTSEETQAFGSRTRDRLPMFSRHGSGPETVEALRNYRVLDTTNCYTRFFQRRTLEPGYRRLVACCATSPSPKRRRIGSQMIWTTPQQNSFRRFWKLWLLKGSNSLLRTSSWAVANSFPKNTVFQIRTLTSGSLRLANMGNSFAHLKKLKFKLTYKSEPQDDRGAIPVRGITQASSLARGIGHGIFSFYES